MLLATYARMIATMKEQVSEMNKVMRYKSYRQ